MPNGPLLRSLLRFLSVGSVGFLVDAGVPARDDGPSGAGPYFGRAGSIGVAALVTWRLNRRYTFAASGRPEWQEAIRYFSGGRAGVGPELCDLCLLIGAGTPPLGALIIASGLLLGFSYTFYRLVVFSGPKPG